MTKPKSGELPSQETGLWALERNLVIDPNIAEFPFHCLFTGEPVDDLTEMIFVQVKIRQLGPIGLVDKKQLRLSVPVSLSYCLDRAKWSKKVRAILVSLGIALAIGGIAIPIGLGMKGEALGSTICFAVSFSILALIVGVAFPYLEDMNGSKCISGVRFLQDGRIVIPKVHESILVGLPELERGYLDGLFTGIDSIKLKA